jgi:hypothetical protein
VRVFEAVSCPVGNPRVVRRQFQVIHLALAFRIQLRTWKVPVPSLDRLRCRWGEVKEFVVVWALSHDSDESRDFLPH